MTEEEKRTAQMDTGSTDLVKRLVKHDAELRAAKSWALHYNEPEGKLWGEAAYALHAAEERMEKMRKYIIGHHSSDQKDYGCKECVPDCDSSAQSDFICMYHRALAEGKGEG